MGGKNVYKLGKQYELKLLRLLTRLGFLAFRVPASGRGRKRTLPVDVVAIGRNRVILFEVKYRKNKAIVELELNRYNFLINAKKRYGVEAYICAWYTDVKEFLCVDVEDYSNMTSYCAYYSYLHFLRNGRKVQDIVNSKT